MLPIVAASIGVTSEVAAFQPVGSVVSTTMRRTIKGRTLVPLKSPGFHPSLSFTRLRQHNQKFTFLNGGGPSDEIISMAYDWTVNLGAPAALVAGERLNGNRLNSQFGVAARPVKV